MESAKGKARQGRRVSLCGAGLRGNPGLTGYERAEASLGLCRPHPPFSPPPASSSPSSFLVFLLLLLFLPLPSTPQQLPPGKGSGAEGGAAASTDSFENFLNWGAEADSRLQLSPLRFCRGRNLGSQYSLVFPALSPLPDVLVPAAPVSQDQSHHFHSDPSCCCSSVPLLIAHSSCCLFFAPLLPLWS